MHEYLVIEIVGSPETLTARINDYAKENWSVFHVLNTSVYDGVITTHLLLTRIVYVPLPRT